MLPHGRTPTHEHELIVTLFHDDPHLVVDLLRLVFGIEIPEDVKAGPDDTTLSKPAPAVYSSDGVVAWERFMEVPEGYKYQSDFAKKYYGQGHTEGMKQGTEAAFGALRRSIGRVLAHRRIELPSEVRLRVESCDDLKTLETWIERATTAQNAAEIFDGD